MYDNIKCGGKTLKDWRELLHGMFSLGELYQMAKTGVDLSTLVPKSALRG